MPRFREVALLVDFPLLGNALLGRDVVGELPALISLVRRDSLPMTGVQWARNGWPSIELDALGL
jgi:hypothetical protein